MNIVADIWNHAITVGDLVVITVGGVVGGTSFAAFRFWWDG